MDKKEYEKEIIECADEIYYLLNKIINAGFKLKNFKHDKSDYYYDCCDLIDDMDMIRNKIIETTEFLGE